MKKKIITMILLGTLSLSVTSCGEPSNAPQEVTGNESTNTTQKQEDTSLNKDENIPTEHQSALNKANVYSEQMHMSKNGIYNQLTSEYGDKFTSEAAQYAIDNLKANWKANALEKAKEYSDSMFMSKTVIYNQLVSKDGENFSKKQAQYAIDNLDVDWKANALEKAKSYQNDMDMSPAAIYDQLISEYGEQFTEEEAQYAIDNLK